MTAANERGGRGVGTTGDASAPPPPWPRMAVALLSLVGVFIAGYLMLHRLGFIGSLLCGKSGACEVVQSSYATFAGVPVPAVGLGGYLVLFVLALVGLRPELSEDRRITLALLALTLVALALTGYLNALEAFVIHAWCRWCVASTIVVALIFICALADLATVAGRARAAVAWAADTPEEP